MTKTVLIMFFSLFLPLLFLVATTLLAQDIAHLLTIWPLKLIEATGVMGSNPEGFYNKWIDTSLIASLCVQSITLYLIITYYQYRLKNKE